MTSTFRFISLTFLLASATTAFSQSFYAIRKDRSVIGYVGVGSATYWGELSPIKTSLTPFKYGMNVGLAHYFTSRFSGRAEVSWFQISGSDAKNAIEGTAVRNLSFVSNCVEGNAAIMFDLLPNGRRFYQRQSINFYGFLGVGVVYANPKTEYNGQMVALRPLQTEGVKYSPLHAVIPFGGGVRFKMGPFFNLAIEGGMRKTFTDYLDDVSSKTYPDPATLSSDLARALSNRSENHSAGVRGNPESKDWYFLMNAKLQYYLPYDLTAFRRNKLYTQKRRYNRRR
jgi:hypothetical protein